MKPTVLFFSALLAFAALGKGEPQRGSRSNCMMSEGMSPEDMQMCQSMSAQGMPTSAPTKGPGKHIFKESMHTHDEG